MTADEGSKGSSGSKGSKGSGGSQKSKGASGRVTFEVSTASRPEFDGALVAHLYDANGEHLETTPVKSGKVTLGLSEGELREARLFLAPVAEELDAEGLTPARLERLGAYEPVLAGPEGLIDRIRIPGDLIDRWPLCFCRVRGRVVRASDGRPVCGARVRICEVDRVPWWILRLPDPDVLRLRDDLLDVLRNPPIPRPRPIPDPPPFERPLFRFEDPASVVGFNPQPEPPGATLAPASIVGFNPQPEPPGLIGPMFRGARGPSVEGSPQPEPPTIVGPMFATPVPEPPNRPIELDPELAARLRSASTTIVREALVENWRLILPWLCIWPWWWWRFRCDEVGVRTTDEHGRFEAIVFYPCGGDHPDLYFSVEFDFGSGFETVYHPPIACNTRWNYDCGTEVTIHVADPRVPACGGGEDLPGCQVVIQSIGEDIAVRELQTDAAGAASEGLTTGGRPLGGTLEPRVEFSRTCLIETKDIPYYRWSYRRLSAPDGTTPDVGSWTPLTRDIYRHYDAGDGTFPSITLGPLPTTGADPAPLPNLFLVPPADPPDGSDGWSVWNEHVDLASGYFDTASLPDTPPHGPVGDTPAPDDLAAGRYELKFELFDADGNLVNWTDEGIELRITEQNAPFGPPTITTELAPDYNRILYPGTGDTLGFRMVLRVDNNHCFADIHPVAGDVPPDPACGFHEYASPTDEARLSFVARHPNRFATYYFGTRRASEPGDLGAASTSGVAGAAGTGGFLQTGPFEYAKDVSVGTLLGSCDQAAFSERLHVVPMVTNGYHVINGYRDDDVAAFALAKPCEACECEDSAGNGQGLGQGQGSGGGPGRGSGRRG